MPFTQHLATEADLLQFAAQLACATEDSLILFLHGPLGAGKTTFARGFLSGLGFNQKVKSPTYTLVEPYDIAGRSIFHFDLYRIHSPQELADIGIQDYFCSSSICLIEWPEKGEAFLPSPDLVCHIDFLNHGREIRIEAYSERGKRILAKLSP